MKTKLFAIVQDGIFYIKTDFQGKFKSEEIDLNTDELRIVMYGVILNLKILCGESSLENYILQKIKQESEDFFKEFRGNFCGVVFNKSSNKCMIFTDQFSTETIFYYYTPEKTIISTSALEIVMYLKKNNQSPNINIKGAYQLLTYGYMIENNTLYDGIKKVLPGEYIVIIPDCLKQKKYYEIRNNQIQISQKDAVEQIDYLFLNAVDLQAKKNIELGYSNYAALSAGMDSRVVCYALKRLGYEDVCTFTYSQSNELDNIIPQKIAEDLGYIWIFKSLDNGLDMLDIEDAVKIGDGIQYYLWPAQLNGFLKLINTEKMGIVHTGVIGDVVVGSFYRQLTKKNYKIGDGAYSRTLLHKVKEMCSLPEKDYEIGMFYNRGINGASAGYSTSFHQYCEPLSPFMNLEFFDFCLSLPVEFRIGHRLYYQWVLKYYPESTRFSHNGLKIRRSNLYIKYHDRPIPLNGIFDRLISNIKSKIGINRGMNPVEYWYNTNKRLKDAMDSYFLQYIELIKNKELKLDMEQLYQNGTVMEKAMCLSVVGTLKVVDDSKLE